MATKRRRLTAAMTAAMLTACSAMGADWPQWRGPNRDGKSVETIAPWTEAPKVLWELPIGEAHSSPVVVAGRVFCMEKVGTDEIVRALSATDGKELWKHQYNAPFSNVYGNGPRATPTVDAGKVYTLGARGDLRCLEAETGKLVWELNLLSKFKASNLFFGTSASPIVTDGLVLVMAGGENAGVVALDAATGETRWTSQSDRASYASPILVGKPGDRQGIFLTQQGLLAVSVKDGKALWRWPLATFNDENSVTPVAAGDLILGSSISYGLTALKPQGDEPTKVWKADKVTCYFSTPVVVGGEVYAVTGTPAMLKCLDLSSGKELWQHGPVGLLSANLLVAGENLLIQTDTGLLLLARPDRGGFKQLAKAQGCGPGWMTPAISDGKLFLRDNKQIKCLEVKGASR
jgi:outer membrane protein assembly factor BamB